MQINKDNLTIRNASAIDAKQLCIWWNDGNVMFHAGFPNGLNTTVEAIGKQLETDDDKIHRRCIIEYNNLSIGEMNYRTTGEKIAEIGIKICDFNAQNKGLGTALLTMFINSLFSDFGYEKIILDTNLKNTRAQHIYEKMGFKKLRINESAWRDQLGELQTSIDYELNITDWPTI